MDLDLNGFNGSDDAAADGSDTFNVTPSDLTAFHVDGDQPTPPTLPGDTLNVNTAGTTSPLPARAADRTVALPAGWRIS